MFSSAQLLERGAPLWRSSTHRGCCLGSSPRTHRSSQSPTACFKTTPRSPVSASPCPTPRSASLYTRTRRAFYAPLDASAPVSVALPPAPYHTDAPVRLQHRSTFLWIGPHFIQKVKASCNTFFLMLGVLTVESAKSVSCCCASTS